MKVERLIARQWGPIQPTKLFIWSLMWASPWRRQWSRGRASSRWASPPSCGCYRRWRPGWWWESRTGHTACPASTPGRQTPNIHHQLTHGHTACPASTPGRQTPNIHHQLTQVTQRVQLPLLADKHQTYIINWHMVSNFLQAKHTKGIFPFYNRGHLSHSWLRRWNIHQFLLFCYLLLLWLLMAFPLR